MDEPPLVMCGTFSASFAKFLSIASLWCFSNSILTTRVILSTFLFLSPSAHSFSTDLLFLAGPFVWIQLSCDIILLGYTVEFMWFLCVWKCIVLVLVSHKILFPVYFYSLCAIPSYPFHSIKLSCTVEISFFFYISTFG